jgi:hypothetical protein
MANCCVGVYSLCINQYATYTKIFTWLAPPPSSTTVGATPLPVDLTGYTAMMQFRPYVLGPLLFDASPYLVLGGTAGTITLTIPAAQTAGFTWWQGFYDLILTSPSGIVTRLLEGTVTVSPGVTP